jgi:hypothetical protein
VSKQSELDRHEGVTNFHPHINFGYGFIDGQKVKVVQVKVVNAFTVPLDASVSDYAALTLADAIARWDAGMADWGDDPLHHNGPPLAPTMTIRRMLPKMRPCEFKEVFTSTHGEGA